MKIASLLLVTICVVLLSVVRTYAEDNKTAGQPPAFAAGKQPIFQPMAMDPALVRQSMQARSEYDDINRRIIARQTKLYEENPRIKELQTELRDLQKKIDGLMAQDEELKELKKKHEAITPEMPMGSRRGFPTNAAPVAPVQK